MMTELAIGGFPWRAWYDDGRVFGSDTINWEDAPDDGLLVKILYYPTGGKQIQQGVDYYYEVVTRVGLVQGAGMSKDEIPARYPGAAIKRGRWAPDTFYRGVVDAAMASTWEF